MKTVGFPISQKANEKRRCLIPEHIHRIRNKSLLFVESGYGHVLGYSDSDYELAGVNVVAQEEVLKKDIICDAKIGDAAYLSSLQNQTIFGWIHAVQNREITDILLSNNLVGYAWEDMFESGRHVFWRNNEIAGEAAVLHAYSLYGKFPYDTKVALIGRGNIGRGALKILTLLGADVTIYDRKTESLLREEIEKYDVVVNCVLWDTAREDHLIFQSDLERMKKGAMIIDVSCDRNGGIETCIPTSMNDPIYEVEGIIHYAVDHTPSIFYKSISNCLSNEVSRFVDFLIEDTENEVLEKSLIINNGKIIDQRIIQFQKRID